MEYLYQTEDKDAIRWSWNLWPCSRIEYKKLVAPLACMYSPLKRTTNLLQMMYNPIPCSKCTAFLNPYCQMEQGCRFWNCPFCFQRNAFPPSYQGISETNLPAELMPDCTTIEYCQPALTPVNPIFLFVLDTTMSHPQELEALKESLLRTLDVIPKDALVGFVTFGATVQVYELSYPYLTKTICFDGTHDYTPAEVQRLLNVGIPTSNGGATPNPVNPYILPLREVEVQLANILEELQQDPQAYNPREMRAARATGVALSVALSLLQWTFPNTGGRVLLMSGGPVTIGPGLVVGRELKEDIRSHHHLKQETAKHVVASTRYFEGLASRAVSQGHAVDIFSCSLDQIGILEMKSLIRQTGGFVVSGESFTHATFRESLFKLFCPPANSEDQGLDMAFNASLELVMSPEIKVTGAIGHLASANKKSTYVSDSVVGIGGTSGWKICSMNAASTYAFYFDIVNAHNNPIPDNRYGMVQFRTSYQHASGTRIMRVTTVAHRWSAPVSGLPALVPLFDQEATLALVARMIAFRTEQEESDPKGWLDKHLIQLCHTFGQFTKNREETFNLPPEISLYPEFIFHFRRSNLCQVFGNSPDETTYFRYYLLRENVSNILSMVQPSLDLYSLEQEEPMPVILSSTSIKQDRLFLLDTFFHVVVFSGDTIAKWRNAGYHLQEGYENLKQLLEAPVKDAQDIISSRLPVPVYIECDSGTSQARYLYAVLDPAETHKNAAQPGSGQGGRVSAGVAGEIMYTEDVPLSVFLSHLYKKAVSFEG